MAAILLSLTNYGNDDHLMVDWYPDSHTVEVQGVLNKDERFDVSITPDEARALAALLAHAAGELTR